jgi:hypothetical protein
VLRMVRGNIAATQARQARNIAYRLDLPAKWQIHPTFYVGKHQRYVSCPSGTIPAPASALPSRGGVPSHPQSAAPGAASRSDNQSAAPPVPASPDPVQSLHRLHEQSAIARPPSPRGRHPSTQPREGSAATLRSLPGGLEAETLKFPTSS